MEGFDRVWFDSWFLERQPLEAETGSDILHKTPWGGKREVGDKLEGHCPPDYVCMY